MNGYYINTNGIKSDYELQPNYEKTLFLDAIKDRLKIADNKEFVGVEIGVLNGETSGFFLNEFDNLKLFGIDPIIPDSMEKSLIGNIETIKNNIGNNTDRWVFYQDYSYNKHTFFQDDSVDFLFIDGDHTYDAVAQDYNLFFSKIKKGGLIFMHDSRMNRGGANFHIGSSQFADYIIANDNRVSLIGEAFSLTCFQKK